MPVSLFTQEIPPSQTVVVCALLFHSVKISSLAKRSAQQEEKSRALYNVGIPASGGCVSSTQGLLKCRKSELLTGDLPQGNEWTVDGWWEATLMVRGCVGELNGQVDGVGLPPDVCLGGKGHKPTGNGVSCHTFWKNDIFLVKGNSWVLRAYNLILVTSEIQRTFILSSDFKLIDVNLFQIYSSEISSTIWGHLDFRLPPLYAAFVNGVAVRDTLLFALKSH